MKIKRAVTALCVVIAITISAGRIHAQHMNVPDAPCRTDATTLDMFNCFSTALDKSDSDLNRLYQRVQTVVSGDELVDLKAAQRLWIKFRDANCDAEHELYDGGTAAPVVKLACLEAMTRHRTEELKVMYGWRLEKWGR